MHLDWNGESQHFLYNRIVNCVPLEIGFQCNIVCIEKIKNVIINNKKIKKYLSKMSINGEQIRRIWYMITCSRAIKIKNMELSYQYI